MSAREPNKSINSCARFAGAGYVQRQASQRAKVPGRKTQETDASVGAFVESIPDLARRKDCGILVDIFREATGKEPKMWGTHIVGFGKRHYRYANGKPAEICRVGFAPRAKSFSFYLASFPGSEELYKNLGKHRFSGGCLHIKALADINQKVLKRIIRESYNNVKSESA